MSNDHTRRGFLAVAGAGAAGAAGAAVLGSKAAGAATAAAEPASAPVSVPAAASEPLVAYVRDAHNGEIAVMFGEHEVIVHDKDLAARIARAAHGNK